MKNLKLIEKELYEMANIQPSRTGISSVLYATFNSKNEGFKHSARVKVRNNYRLIPVQLEPDVKIPPNVDISKLKN